MENEKQIEFLKGLLQSLNDALAMNQRILTALEVGGVKNESAAYDYLKDLNDFMTAGIKVIWQTHFAYSDKNSKTVAKETLGRENIEN